MSSKLRQKASSILAVLGIALLVVLIIMLWVLAEQGAFRKRPTSVVQQPSENIQLNEEELIRRKEKKIQHKWKEHNNEIIDKGPKDIPKIDDVPKVEDNHYDTEFIKPLKISPPPLHDHDIIYDQIQGRDVEDEPSIRHHSGHFRHKMAEIWDPHPEYEIHAFGKKIHLVLAHNDKFILPQVQVTHVWSNFTQKVKPNIRTSGCYYTGKVKGDERSTVAVSLCGGMTGYISSTDGSFYIEPVEKFQNFSIQSILHKIHRIPFDKHFSTSIINNNNSNNNNNNHHHHKCEAEDNPTSGDNVSAEHHINKRDINSKKYVGTRRSGNQQYYIETLVVADKKMAEYHKTQENLIHYILVLMAHVALLFKDATIGNPITMVVVKISILKDREFVKHNSKNGVHSSELLRKFCEYQSEINVKETTDGAVHHDIALLLTRKKLCKDKMIEQCNITDINTGETICRNYTAQQCDTLGLAELGTMCNSDRSCAIIKDKGLPTSYTIAHEVGHVLNMPHDDDKRCNQFRGEKKINNIMSKMLENDTKPWLWSACSKYFLTEFLDTNRGFCLLNHPKNDLVSQNIPKRLPGETFDQDRQCELVYGTGSKICSFMPSCRSLWCATPDGGEDIGCRTMSLPWADGTSCGYGKWCHRGECVELDRGLLQPIEGAWGPWKPWGACSRPCGGGIRKSERFCDSPAPANGGMYCTGRSVRYMSCNTQQCDESVMDFRAEQCAKHNGDSKGIPNLGDDVKWDPKYGEPLAIQDVCKLYCRVAKANSYYMLADKVVDGTKCGLDSFNICINGICHPGGCDNRLDSNKTLDECGICGGDNSKCKEIIGRYNAKGSYGYNKIVRIPKGSSTIDIRQHGYNGSSKDDNYLALVDSETGLYILNGNYMVSTFRKLLVYAGVTIEYSGSNNVVERINTSRSIQLKRDLIVEVLTVGPLRPPDIVYSYKITSDSVPKYSWQLYNNWTPCNSICSGLKSAIPVCVKISTNQPVSEEYCSNLALDGAMVTQPCNTHCALSWKKKSYSQCSAHCGIGERQIYFKCARTNLTMEDSKQNLLDEEGNLDDMPWWEPVDDLHCANVPRPNDREPCKGPCDETRWDYGIWSKCTKTCGSGIQTRSAVCIDSNNNEIDSFACKREPVTQQICNTQKCPTWAYFDWTPCSTTCGKGFKKKPAVCQNGNEVVNSDLCDSRYLKNITKDCFERPCTKWYSGEWSHCSASCGKGIQKREVYCKTFEGDILDDMQCYGKKPVNTGPCMLSKCPDMIPFKPNIINEIDDNSILPTFNNYKYEWRSGKWSECSKTCNGGIMSRRVVCENEAGVQSDERCDPSKRPLDSIQCNISPCPEWNYGAWSGCDSNCFQFRQVICQHHNGDIADDSYCSFHTKPPNKQECTTKPCRKHMKTHKFDNDNSGIISKPQWRVEAWSSCSKSCGRGTKTRLVYCFDSDMNVKVVDHFCKQQRKPKTHRYCFKNDCSYTWVEGQWTQCTVSCGEGNMYRNVTCHKVHPGGKIDTNPVRENPRHNYCELKSKPPNVQKCITRYCNELYSWNTGRWQECSHQCGRKGRQIRIVMCHDQNGKNVQRKLCSKSLRPPRKRKCNQRKCNLHSCRDVKHKMKVMNDGEYFITVRGKGLKVYCRHMNQVHPQEFITLPNEGRENYAEIYDKRLVNTYSCPNNGKRDEDCKNCVLADPDRSGLTVFSKIRLNVTSLRVIGNDFTFARQIKGKQIPYGTAGDCYSSLRNCPQGRFSIDLSETGLRLSPKTTWVSKSQTSSILINKQEMKVSGKCGGYCGYCEPDHTIGLLLEII